MSLSVLDSGGNVQQLKATLTSGQLIPHHHVDSCALPTDAATQTTLAAVLAAVVAQATLAQTQPVSAASLPLPTGAATSAAQTTLQAEVEAVRDDLAEVITALEALVARGTAIAGYNSTAITDTTATTIVTPGSGLKIHLTRLVLANGSAVKTYVNIASNATVKARVWVPAESTVVLTWDPENPLILATDEPLKLTAVTNASEIHASYVGFEKA